MLKTCIPLVWVGSGHFELPVVPKYSNSEWGHLCHGLCPPAFLCGLPEEKHQPP